VGRIAALAVVLAACRGDAQRASSAPAAAAPKPRDAAIDARACLGDADVADALAQQQQALVTKAAKPPVLVEDHCWKRVYSYAGYRLAIARKPDTSSLMWSSGIETTRTPECFQRAVTEAEHRVPYAKALLAAAAARKGELWADLDFGGIAWVDCKDPEGSISTLLHEANHTLHVADCLHDPDGPELCFPGMGWTPARKLAHLDKLPATRDATRTAFELQNEEYFVREGNENGLYLFDELLAYGITAEAEAARASAWTKPPDARHVDMLSFMAFMTTRYLEEWRRTNASHYDTVLEPAGKARSALVRLLARTDAAYATWAKERDRLWSPSSEPTRMEDHFWKEYLAGKRRLAL
jgi:hypothetical protein